MALYVNNGKRTGKTSYIYNKNVDIKFSAHDAFLENPSTGTLQIEILDCKIIYSFGSNKTKCVNEDNQYRLRSPMHEGGKHWRYL